MSTNKEWDQELVFHDTVPIEEEHLEDAHEKAAKQTALILEIFRLQPDRNFTAHEIKEIVDSHYSIMGCNEFILITSVRRSITTLTKKLVCLIKCQWSERRMERYGRSNRTWRYNSDYVKPLNA